MITMGVALAAPLKEKRMIEKEQLRTLIDSTLVELHKKTQGKVPYSDTAVELLMMTAAHESKLGTYLEQMNGPALGIFQMEPVTEEDIWDNYLHYREGLEEAVETFTLGDHGELKWNLKYAIVMARIHYYRVPQALPKGFKELAEYAKEHYNTNEGKATSDKYLEDYYKYAI